MAISKDQLTVEVVLDSSGAVKGIKDLQGQFVEFDKIVQTSSKSSNQANQSTGRMGEIFSGVSSKLSQAAAPLLALQAAVGLASQAFAAVKATVSEFVDAYAEAEQAQVLLTRAIENAGGRIQNSADAWGAYLDQIQEVKAVDADVLRGFVAQAIQMGFSEQQTKDLVNAMIGLSKVTGDSLDSAFQKLIGTTRGMARGLSATIPDLQNLTQEQLRSGDAFAIVAEKTKNAASAKGTYTDAVKRAALATGELKEDIGKIIIETFNLTGAMKSSTDTVNSIRSALAAVDVKSLKDNFIELVKSAGPFLFFIGAATAGVSGFAAAAMAAVAPVVLITAKILLIVGAVTAVITIIEMLSNNFGILKDVLSIAANTIALAFIAMARNIAESLTDLFAVFGENNPFAKAARQVADGLQKSVDSLKDNISKSTSNIKKEFDKTFTADLFKQASKAIDGFSQRVDGTTKSLEKLGTEGARTKVIDDKALEKADAALKDIIKQTDQLNLSTATAGKDEIETIRLKATEQIRLINEKEKELEQQGLLNDKLREALSKQKEAVLANKQITIEVAARNKEEEKHKKLLSELDSITKQTAQSLEQARMSNLGTFDLIKAQSAAEMDKLSIKEEELKKAGLITKEKLKEIELTKQGIKEIESIKTGQAIMSGVTGALQAAQGGADALMTNIINQVGAAFGPEGQMIAGLVNLARKGKDFTKQLGTDFIELVKDLPKLVTEGLVGLIEGFIEGLTKFLSDQKAVQAFVENLVKLMPTVMAALVKALPQLVIAMARPSFWITIVKAWAVATIEGFKETWKAFGDALGDVFREVGKTLEKAFLDAMKVFDNIFVKIRGVFWEIGDWFANIFTKIGDNVGQAFKDAVYGTGDFFANIGSKMWEGISWVFNKIGNFFKELFKFDGGGKGAVEEFLGFDFPWIAFAQGGIVPGKSKVMGDSSKNDTVPALLSPGEAVIPRSMMKDEGVASFVGALFSGKKPQKHFLGIPGTESVPFGDKQVNAVTDAIAEGVSSAGEWLGDTFVPENIKKLWDSLKRFISNIDLKRLITDPLGMITDAIKGSLGFLQGPFRQMMKFADGGIVPGTGFQDTVPAMLTPGEFVINRRAAQSLGNGLLNQLNAGRLPSSDASQIFNINLNIETKDALDASFIRNTIIPTIKSELKASSLRGDFVLSAKGVRG